MNMEPGVFFEPCRHDGVLMGRIVIDDQMQIERLGRSAVDGAQEVQPFLMAMALHAASDHRAGRDIEGGEERGRAVPLVIMRHGSSSPLL